MEDIQGTPVPATLVVTDGQDWPHVAKLLGGKPITVGPGQGIAINPLDSTSLDEKTIVGPSRSGKTPIGIQHRQFLSRMELEHGLCITGLSDAQDVHGYYLATITPQGKGSFRFADVEPTAGYIAPGRSDHEGSEAIAFNLAELEAMLPEVAPPGSLVELVPET